MFSRIKFHRDGVIGFTIGLAISLMVLLLNYTGDPVPYSHHTRLVLDQRPNSVIYKAEFYKYDGCVFSDLVPFTVVVGQPLKTDYISLEGRGKKEDRTEGWQVIYIEIDLKGRDPEGLELRARHQCGEELVTTRFDYIDLKVE